MKHVALFTAILGAVAAGNLALLFLDVAWDGQAHERFPAAHPRQTMRTGLSTG